MALGDHWNTREDDLEGPWPCDGFSRPGARALYRAIDVDAPPESVWRWLCQLRVAPYSYDWIDNRGRRSPRTLTPGLDRLEGGQRIMSIFRLVAFETHQHLTLETSGFPGLGPLYVTYRVRPRGTGTRLAVKLALQRDPGAWAALLARGLAVGDWIMMRKQLLTLKRCAEDSAANPAPTTRAP